HYNGEYQLEPFSESHVSEKCHSAGLRSSDAGDPVGYGHPGTSGTAEDGSEDEQEEGSGAPEVGDVHALAGEEIVSHAGKEEAELQGQGLGQHGTGGEEEKDAGDGRCQKKDGRSDHEAFVGFRTIAQKISGDDESGKGKQTEQLKGQESQW